MSNYLYIVLCILFLIPNCMSDICETCACFETDAGPTIDCHKKQLGTNDILNFDLLMLNEHQQLNKLIFSENGIVDLPMHILRKLKQLKCLDLSNNLISEIHTDVFLDLNKLEDLDFSMNRLKVFDDTLLKTLPTLLMLNLSHNYIDSFEHTFGTTQGIVHILDLSHNNLSELSNNSLASFQTLEHLDLSFNSIHYLGEDVFMHFNSLKTLILNNNLLSALDLQIFPKTLIELYCKFNTIADINYVPSAIRKLDLAYNNISEMAEGLEMLTRLQDLNISGNSLMVFQEMQLETLESLDISYNNFSSVPVSLSVKNLPNLRTLNISGNSIHKLRFSSELELYTLHVSNISSLKAIQADAFINLRSPSTSCLNLTLSNNKELSMVHEKCLEHLKICALDLSNNYLTSIPKKLIALKSDFKVYSVNLEGNPFNCNCSLQWMLNDLIPKLYTHHPRLLNNLRCNLPSVISNMRMVHWYGWQEEVFCSDISNYKENLAVEITSVSNTKIITFESSTGLLTIIGAAIGVLTILVTVGLLLTRRMAEKRRRFNRRF